MNGLQSLDEWKSYFHNPGASTLALYADINPDSHPVDTNPGIDQT